MSLVLVGAGQVYNGELAKGFAFAAAVVLLVFFGFLISSAGSEPAAICFLLAAAVDITGIVDAYNSSERIARGEKRTTLDDLAARLIGAESAPQAGQIMHATQLSRAPLRLPTAAPSPRLAGALSLATFGIGAILGYNFWGDAPRLRAENADLNKEVLAVRAERENLQTQLRMTQEEVHRCLVRLEERRYRDDIPEIR